MPIRLPSYFYLPVNLSYRGLRSSLKQNRFGRSLSWQSYTRARAPCKSTFTHLTVCCRNSLGGVRVLPFHRGISFGSSLPAGNYDINRAMIDIKPATLLSSWKVFQIWANICSLWAFGSYCRANNLEMLEISSFRG